jgi:hypothetical protein
MGVHNQLVYADPKRELIITKLSASHSYASSAAAESLREPGHFAFFREAARRR